MREIIFIPCDHEKITIIKRGKYTRIICNVCKNHLIQFDYPENCTDEYYKFMDKLEGKK